MGTIAASFAGCDSIVNSENQKSKEDPKGSPTPLIISTWPHILDNQIALKAVKEGNLLDGIEKGINNVENNPLDQSVGIGGRPDRTGTVTLDACIMDKEHRAGSVCYLKEYQTSYFCSKKSNGRYSTCNAKPVMVLCNLL